MKENGPWVSGHPDSSQLTASHGAQHSFVALGLHFSLKSKVRSGDFQTISALTPYKTVILIFYLYAVEDKGKKT